MRVLQVVPYYAPAWAFGGPPKVMWEEARHLSALGHDVSVITTDAYDAQGRSPAPRQADEDVYRLRQCLQEIMAWERDRLTDHQQGQIRTLLASLTGPTWFDRLRRWACTASAKVWRKPQQ